MAVEQLRLSSLTMETLPDAYSQIVQAICERKTILNAFDYGIQGSCTNDYGFLSQHQPNFAMSMNALLECVRRIGSSFFDEDAEYIEQSYSNFPKTFGNKIVTDEEHSVGVSIMQFDTFTEPTIEDWRNVLGTAAYWLNKFTKIHPKFNATTTLYCPYTTSSWWDTEDWGTYEIVPTAESEREMSFSIQKWYRESCQPTQYDPDPYHVYKDGALHVRARCGLAIDNKTPYDASVLLYSCMPEQPESNWASRDKWQTIDYNMRTCTNYYQPDPDDSFYLWPGKTSNRSVEQVLAGDGWKDAYYSEEDTIYTVGRDFVEDNHQLCLEYEQYETNYSHDGSSSYLMHSENSSQGENPNSTYTSYSINFLDFRPGTKVWDGFGIWNAVGVPLNGGTVPARTKQVLASTVMSSVPLPNSRMQNMIPADWTRGGVWWEEHLFADYTVRIVPILDFTDSITTFEVV